MQTSTAHLSTVAALLHQDLHEDYTAVPLGALTEAHCVHVEDCSCPSHLSTSATRQSWHDPINETLPHTPEDHYRS